MLKPVDPKTPILVSQSSVYHFSRITENNASLQIHNLATQNPRRYIVYTLNSRSIPIQNPIVSAKRKPRRTQSRSQASTRFLINLASLVLSNLRVLPQPLDLVLDEIGGGDGFSGAGGGGIGFWKGFGRGGFDGWGRRRKRKRIDLWVYGLFAAICVVGFMFGREFESDAIWWGLGFGPFGIAVIRWWEKIDGVQGWVFLGFCLWSFVVGVSFRRERLRKWIDLVKSSCPVIVNLGKRTRKGKFGKRFFG